MMSTSGDIRDNPLIDPPSEHVSKLREQPIPPDRESRIERMVTMFRDYITGQRYPMNDEFVRKYATALFERDGSAGDAPRLLQALFASLPAPAERIQAPTLVIHGTADPLLRYSAGSAQSARYPARDCSPSMAWGTTSPRRAPSPCWWTSLLIMPRPPHQCGCDKALRARHDSLSTSTTHLVFRSTYAIKPPIGFASAAMTR